MSKLALLITLVLVLTNAGCGVYPVLIPPEATPPGTVVGSTFLAAGGKRERTNFITRDVSPGVLDVGAQARLGVLPGIELGGRVSLAGGALADVRLQPLRRPVSLSLDIAAFTNHYLGDWMDPHISQPITYRGFRPSAMVGVGRVYCGVAYSLARAWGPGMGVGAELNDTFDIRSAFAGVELGNKIRALVEAEVFKVQSRRANEYGVCLGLAGYSSPIRIWGRRESD